MRTTTISCNYYLYFTVCSSMYAHFSISLTDLWPIENKIQEKKRTILKCHCGMWSDWWPAQGPVHYGKPPLCLSLSPSLSLMCGPSLFSMSLFRVAKFPFPCRQLFSHAKSLHLPCVHSSPPPSLCIVTQISPLTSSVNDLPEKVRGWGLCSTFLKELSYLGHNVCAHTVTLDVSIK